jgi:Glycosyl transferase family 2
MTEAAVFSSLFWGSVLLILYAYAGYPLLLYGLSLLRTRTVRKAEITPPVSFIITAHNEQARIRQKLENTLRLAYPRDRLQVLVASDCSTDGTDGTVQEFRAHGVQLVRSPIRRGKEAAQKEAIEVSRGEILVFSDVGTMLDAGALTQIVNNFADPTVGCVSSEDRIVDADGRVTGENAYVRYEMLLRSLETRVNSLVGLSGSFFAARRHVCQPWRSDLQSDFNTLLNSIRRGLRGVSDPHSIGYYKNIAAESREFERKVRTVVRGLAVFMNSLPLLNPLRHGLFAWQLLSHKLCRWLVPFLLTVVFLTSAVLAASSPFFLMVFCIQVIVYGSVFMHAIRGSSPSRAVLKVPFYFIMTNAAILVAWYRFAKGERYVIWRPSER